jgi:hypothetical protein
MIPFGRALDKYVLAALIVFEMAACYNFYSREIAWFPPGNWDQCLYLAEAYRVKERILTNGFGQLANIISSPYNNGMALPILGAVSSLCLAGGRLPVLFVPFLGFILLQVSAFVTGQTVWRSRTYGYLLLGLILCLNTPWYWAGGLFDFRFDFMAFSLFGIWACAVMQSQIFLDRRWAIACGLIGALLVLTRFLTLLYLLGISIGLGLVCAAVAGLSRDSQLARRMWRRVYNLVVSTGVLAIVVTPFLNYSWREILQYYGIGHLLGNVSKAHAHQSGVDSLVERLFFYPNSILRDHWGVAFAVSTAIVLAATLIVAFSRSPKTSKLNLPIRDETFALQIVFLVAAIVGPILVLTIDASKNSVVGGIVGVPAGLLVVALSARDVGVRTLDVYRLPRALIGCAIVVCVLGVATVVDRISRHDPEYAEREDLGKLVDLNKWMVTYASDHGWYHPGISLDTISPWFYGYSITDTGYEAMGKFIEFRPLFGGDIMGAGHQEALAQLAQSDFFIVTTAAAQQIAVASGTISPNTSREANYEWLSVLRRLKPFYNPSVQPVPSGISLEGSNASLQRWPAERQHRYPFYQHLAQYRDDLKAWADKNMTLAQTVPFRNFTATIYVRSTVGSDLSDNGH